MKIRINSIKMNTTKKIMNSKIQINISKTGIHSSMMMKMKDNKNSRNSSRINNSKNLPIKTKTYGSNLEERPELVKCYSQCIQQRKNLRFTIHQSKLKPDKIHHLKKKRNVHRRHKSITQSSQEKPERSIIQLTSYQRENRDKKL